MLASISKDFCRPCVRNTSLTCNTSRSILCVQARIAHNKRRDQLKSYMQTLGGADGSVDTSDLQLAAKLAKMDLPEEFLLKTPYANQYTAEWDPSSSSPRAIKWRPFIDAIEYPSSRIRPPSCLSGFKILKSL